MYSDGSQYVPLVSDFPYLEGSVVEEAIQKIVPVLVSIVQSYTTVKLFFKFFHFRPAFVLFDQFVKGRLRQP